MNVKLDSFAKLLIEKKLITESQAFSCMSEALQSRVQFFDMLHAKRWIEDRLLAKSVAEHFKMNLYDWETFSPQFIPKNIIDEKIPKAIIIPAKSASERSNSFPNFMPNKPFPFR